MKTLSPLLISLLMNVAFAATCFSQEAPPPASREAQLRLYLQEEHASERTSTLPASRYLAVFVNLDDWGPEEVIVYWLGQHWCGSGGCSMDILIQEKNTFRQQSHMSISNPPIRMLDSKSYGWHDLGIGVRGGGIQPGFEAQMKHNGNAYPLNPSTNPEAPRNAPGKVLISDEMLKQAVPLF